MIARGVVDERRASGPSGETHERRAVAPAADDLGREQLRAARVARALAPPRSARKAATSIVQLAVDDERPVAVERRGRRRRAARRPRRCSRAGTRRCRRRASRRRRRAGRRRGAAPRRCPRPPAARCRRRSRSGRCPPGSASARCSWTTVVAPSPAPTRAAPRRRCVEVLVVDRVDRDEHVRLAGAQAGLPVLGRARPAVAEALGARRHALAELVREARRGSSSGTPSAAGPAYVNATCMRGRRRPVLPRLGRRHLRQHARSAARARGRRRRCAGTGRRPSGTCSRAGRCPGCRRGRCRRPRTRRRGRFRGR